MDLNATIALATANGWSDDSQFSRSTIETQISSLIDGWIATVSILNDGTIRWGVVDENDRRQHNKGIASTFDAAMSACRMAVSAASGTLF